MKSYREIADSVFARRERYIIAQRKKKQAITRAAVSVGSVTLVSLAGIALLRNDAFHDTPPVTDGGVTTTTTAKPTEEKILITADEPDEYLIDFEVHPGRNEVLISPLMQEKMEEYRNSNVYYAVFVRFTPFEAQLDEFWQSTEELTQLYKEYYDVYYAFYNEAKELNPSWKGTRTDDIEIWTDTMRANNEYWLTLIEKRENVETQCFPEYAERICKQHYQQKYEVLVSVCETEPIECSYDSVEGYYVELTAKQIQSLVSEGGYILCLSVPDGFDEAPWDFE